MTICAFLNVGKLVIRTGLVLAAAMALAVPVWAEPQDGPTIDLGAGAGYARALHGDLDFGTATISGTARVRVGRLVVFEPQVGYWRHTDRQTFLTTRGEQIESRSTRSFTSITGSVLVVAPDASRVQPYAGGGVGLFFHTSKFEQTGFRDLPPILRTTERATAGGQAIGGVDVRTAGRVKVFGEVRFEVQSFDDPGSSAYRVLGGVRVRIG